MKRIRFGFLLAVMIFSTACAAPADGPASPSPVFVSASPAPVFEAFSVASTPAPTLEPTPVPTPSPVPTVTPEAFSLIWIADTQVVNELYPETLQDEMAWAVQERDARNIKAVIHTGDIINDVASRRQWNNAAAAFSELTGSLPFLAVAGNHDVGTTTIDYAEFNKNIASLYPDKSRLYAGGRGSYTLLETENLKLILIGIGWAYQDAPVQWLSDTLAKYPDYTAILCVHSYLNPNATLTDGGKILLEQVVKKHRNVRFVLSGHRNHTAYLATPLDDNSDGTPDRTVHQLMYNYQEENAKTLGTYLRILTFDPGARSVSVETYSPALDDTLREQTATFVIENAF